MFYERCTVPVGVLRGRGVSEQAIQLLLTAGGTNIPQRVKQPLLERGFSESDVKILQYHWGDCRIRVSEFVPKKVDILEEMPPRGRTQAVARRHKVTPQYVRKLRGKAAQ